MKSRQGACSLLLCSMGLAALAACGGPSGQTCAVDDDCSSHFCKADGTCGPSPVDAPPGQGDGGVDGSNALCSPNHDGQITLNELPLIAGRSATFRIATSATWNTAGTSLPNGMHHWDLTSALANDADQSLALASPTGAWWSPDYPSATYSAVLAAGSNLQGVFKVDSTGLQLLAVVSPDGGTYKTELDYDPPARILSVPLGNGATWTSTSTVSGYVQGVCGVSSEKYDSRVDLVGDMKTPYGNFPVLRVATDLTRTVNFTPVLTKRTFAWMAECFGSVTSVQSKDNESGSEFSDDAEVRRLVQ